MWSGSTGLGMVYHTSPRLGCLVSHDGYRLYGVWTALRSHVILGPNSIPGFPQHHGGSRLRGYSWSGRRSNSVYLHSEVRSRKRWRGSALVTKSNTEVGGIKSNTEVGGVEAEGGGVEVEAWRLLEV